MTTAIAEKLAEKGIIPRNVRLQLALAEFQNNGGEYGVALAMLNSAYGRGSRGRSFVADGHAGGAAASPTNDGEGRIGDADEAVLRMSSPSTNRSAGPDIIAEKAVVLMPVAANKPGHAKRGLKSIRAVQSTVSKSLFDSTILPDGRRLREVRWSECPILASKYRRLSRVLMAIHNVGTPSDPTATVDQIVNEDRLQEIVSAVEVVNDIH